MTIKRFGFCFAFALCLLVFTFVLGEILFRVLLRDRLFFRFTEVNLFYRYDEALGWFPQPNLMHLFGDRAVKCSNNSRGFRDREPSKDKTKPRLVVLGDSFVWGYDLEEHERFSNRLQSMMPSWDVFNLGVSGYGTDQEWLMFRDQIDYYRPDVVFLLFAPVNDFDNNTGNCSFPYYKPYFVKVGAELQLRGIPVPKCEYFYYGKHPAAFWRSYWLRVMAKGFALWATPGVIKVPDLTGDFLEQIHGLSNERGAMFTMGLVTSNRVIDAWCSHAGVPCVTLQNAHCFPGISGHWNPEGNAEVAEKLYEFFRTSSRVQELSSTRQSDASPAQVRHGTTAAAGASPGAHE